MASPRRTARYERIPPDGFDMAAPESALHEGTPPPPSGGPPPLSGAAILQPACTSNILEKQHRNYRQGQQPALASHRRTARYERIPPDGFDMAAPESALHGGIPCPFATRPAFSPAYRGKTTKKYSTLLHFLPFCAILLRQYRTKSVWRLCTPSACKFPVIFHKNAREYIQYSLRFLFHLTKNLTTHLSHNLCAVFP